jgi:poly(A) polymerase
LTGSASTSEVLTPGRQVPGLHRDWIDSTAFRIVQVLQTSGYETYLVGGCVRDLLVGVHPKDFDIATNAMPDQVRKKIPYSFIIGRRFRLVLVKRGLSQFEIATFRRSPGPEDLENDLSPSGDNFYGTVEEDAKRRDFTINSIFYDPVKDQILDFCHGIADINSRTLRMIGPAKERLLEDSIRILRAVRLAHKLGFQFDEEMREGLLQTCHALKDSALPRRREEYLKILKLEDPLRTFYEMYDLGVLQHALPSLHALFENSEKAEVFTIYFRQWQELARSKMDPVELFTFFLFAFAKAVSPNENLEIEKLAEDQSFISFMKDELGCLNKSLLIS